MKILLEEQCRIFLRRLINVDYLCKYLKTILYLEILSLHNYYSDLFVFFPQFLTISIMIAYLSKSLADG